MGLSRPFLVGWPGTLYRARRHESWQAAPRLGRSFFHSANMTFGIWEIAADAARAPPPAGGGVNVVESESSSLSKARNTSCDRAPPSSFRRTLATRRRRAGGVALSSSTGRFATRSLVSPTLSEGAAPSLTSTGSAGFNGEPRAVHHLQSRDGSDGPSKAGRHAQSEESTGLILTTGVPSIALSGATLSWSPSVFKTVTLCKPRGFGRSGDLIANTRASGRRSSPRGCTFRTSRRDS
jgi:hypothetical protein